MSISDKFALNQEYFARAAAQKENYSYNRKHVEERARVFHEKDRLLENRKLTLLEHDALKRQNEVAMDKEEDQKILFINKSLGLNVI